MAQQTAGRVNGWRIGLWSAAGALLLVPAVAMRFTSEVRWNGTDFLVMGALFLVTGGAIEFLVRRGSGAAYRAGAVLAVVMALLLVWVDLAVGIVGTENNRANLLHAGVIAIGVGGALLARFGPAGMMRTALAMAGAQAAIGAIAVLGGWGMEDPNRPRDVLGASGLFTLLWLAAAALFGQAARQTRR